MEPVEISQSLLSNMICTTRVVLSHVHRKTAPEKVAAIFAGQAAHAALAVHFKGGTVKESMHAFRNYRDFDGGPTWKEWAEQNVPTDDRYMKRLSYENTRLVMKYWLQADEHQIDEMPFTVDPDHVEVGFKYPLTKKGDIVFIGRGDLMPARERKGKATYPVDHKTTYAVQSWWTESFRLGSQMTGYIWVAEKTLGEHVGQACINAIEFSTLPGLDDPEKICRNPDHGKVPYTECQHLHVNSVVFFVKRTPTRLKEWRYDAIELGRKFMQIRDEYAEIESVAEAPMEGTFFGACRYCDFKNFCLDGRRVENLDRMLIDRPKRSIDEEAA